MGVGPDDRISCNMAHLRSEPCCSGHKNTTILLVEDMEETSLVRSFLEGPVGGGVIKLGVMYIYNPGTTVTPMSPFWVPMA